AAEIRNQAPPELYEPVTALVTSGTKARSAAILNEVVTQFDVVHAARYRGSSGQGGLSNIFAWDVTRALGCEVPHWWLGVELNSNALENWLQGRGVKHGWRACLAAEAAG